MGRRPGEAIKLPDNERLEFLLICVGHQAIKLWTIGLCATNPFLHIDFREFPSLALAMFPNVLQLDFRVLMMITRANSCVCNDFHDSLSFWKSVSQSNVLSTQKLSTTCEMICKHQAPGSVRITSSTCFCDG